MGESMMGMGAALDMAALAMLALMLTAAIVTVASGRLNWRVTATALALWGLLSGASALAAALS